MSGRKTKLPLEPVTTDIIDLTRDGKGVAKIDGKTVFIAGALPEEKVKFTYSKIRRSYAEGLTVTIINKNPDRVEPPCEFFNICGGCSLQHLNPKTQIKFKQDALKAEFLKQAKIDIPQLLPPVSGLNLGYRRKARLGVRKVIKKQTVLVGFREKASNFICVMDSCKTLHPAVGEKIIVLRELIAGLDAADKIAQIELAVAQNSTVLVFRNLTPLSAQDSQKLDEFGKHHNFRIYLQAGGADSVAPLNFEHATELFYKFENIKYEFAPGDFTQVNFGINQKMIHLAIELLDIKPEDNVLDLFCGIGNFSLAIATKSSEVLGIELAKSMVEKARHNAHINQINNVKFHTRDLQIKQPPTAIVNGNWNKVLLDPPRSGAKELMPFIGKLKPKRIVYVSCNPATLSRDADILVNEFGYKCNSAGLIDMFPHTAHVESIALFSSK